MSTFEIILVAIIYMFGYGYAIANVASKNQKFTKRDIVLSAILCLIWTLYFPLLLGVDIYNKLNSK